MNKREIKKLLESFENKKSRTIVIVDYGNVEKWKNNLSGGLIKEVLYADDFEYRLNDARFKP